MTNTIRIKHLNIIVEDMKKSLEFYKKILKFEEVRRYSIARNWSETANDRKSTLAECVIIKIPDTETCIELQQYIGLPLQNQDADRVNYFGIRHLALEVDCLEQVVQELTLMGVKTFEAITQVTFSIVEYEKKSVYINGPDNVKIELIEREEQHKRHKKLRQDKQYEQHAQYGQDKQHVQQEQHEHKFDKSSDNVVALKIEDVLQGKSMEQLAVMIYDDFKANRNPSQAILEIYWSRLGLENKEKDELIHIITAGVELILSKLELEPVKLNMHRQSKRTAIWITRNDNYFINFCRSIRAYIGIYNEIFFPTILDEGIRATIREVLTASHGVKNVTSVAEMLFTNRSHLSHKFKSQTGTYLSSYIRTVKMYGARLLLLDPELSIGDIINILGYKDEEHFVDNFKLHTGIHPSKFRSRVVDYY
jgi:AraC-like DNA-binding protein/catechol 2,3-dioxygenase-like lactoylglutathione lyase family enzyme